MYSELNNAFNLNNFNRVRSFLKSQEHFLNISLFEGTWLQNFLVINEISSFRKVAAKLKNISDYFHGLQILVFFTRLSQIPR